MMNYETRLSKNQKIAQHGKDTRNRRKNQDCKVFSIKIQTNKLSHIQKEQLKMLFVEAKWLKNDILAKGVKGYVIGNEVDVKTPAGYVSRKFEYLGSRIRQSVLAETKQNIKVLSVLKKKGRHVGKLKFVSEVKELDLAQYGKTYKIKANKVHIQNVNGWMIAGGTDQVQGCELANAKLLNRPDGYYLNVTCFRDKQEDAFLKDSAIGIDMGVKTHITMSDGTKIKATVEETEHLRRLKQKLSRQEKGSNSYCKTKVRIRRQYQKLTNKKNDISNHIANYLLRYNHVCMQDENIKSWKTKKSLSRGSRTIQHSILGRVKASLVRNPRTIVLDRFEPTTKLCKCGFKNSISLSDRTYHCNVCGYTNDRDVHAAQNMIRIAEQNNRLVPMEHRDFKPVESLLDVLTEFADTQNSMKLEVASLSNYSS
jgi:putative transposase